jgi:hypothetical protein
MLRVVSDVVVQPLTGSYYIGYIWHATPPTIATIGPSLTRKSINAASFWTQQHNTKKNNSCVTNKIHQVLIDDEKVLCYALSDASFLFFSLFFVRK